MLSRRKFIVGASLLAAAGLLGLPAKLLGEVLRSAGRRLITGSGNTVCAIDLENHTFQRIPVDFLPHSFVQHPHLPERFWAIEKWGTSMAEVDFRLGNVTYKLKSPPGTEFYGHGIYSKQKNALFITRVDYQTGLGHLVGYDIENFKPLYDYQVTSAGLHQCSFLPDGTVLITSSGIRRYMQSEYAQHRGPKGGSTLGPPPRVEKTAIVQVDLRDGRVLDKKFLDDESQLFGHFAVSNSGNVLGLTSPHGPGHGGVYFNRAGDRAFKKVELSPSLESGLHGEILSIAIDDKQHVALATNPDTEMVLAIDSESGKLLHANKWLARGVVYDADIQRFVCSGKEVSLIDSAFRKFEPFSLNELKGPLMAVAHSLLV